MDQDTTEAPFGADQLNDELVGDIADGHVVFPPRAKVPKWPFILGILLLLVGFTLNWLANLEVDYFALSPGPVNDVGDFVSVVGEESIEDAGELFFLTVAVKEVTALQYIGAWLDPEVSLSKRETIRPAGVSQEELTRQNLALMDGSKRDAKFVAFAHLGLEPQLIGSGALIVGTIDGTAASGVLEVDDVIVGVDGNEVEFSADAIDVLAGKVPGTEIQLVIERPGDDGSFERLEVSLVLGPFLGTDENDEPIVDESRGMIGVLLGDAFVEERYPIDVDIDTQNIGGPSAGLMFTLELINQLTDDDITRDQRIAGTGTISRDGTVGAIGGVQQKVYGAIGSGADYVLVPASNYDDALVAAGDDITVIRVETIDDALAFLDTL
jgi:PDZ domain-containing protein